MIRRQTASGICDRCGAVGFVWKPALLVDDRGIGMLGAAGGPTLCRTCEAGLGYRRIIPGMYLETTAAGERRLHFYPYELARKRGIDPSTANLAALLVALQNRARQLFPTLMAHGTEGQAL
jgi:hypothetical protein